MLTFFSRYFRRFHGINGLNNITFDIVNIFHVLFYLVHILIMHAEIMTGTQHDEERLQKYECLIIFTRKGVCPRVHIDY